MERTVVLLVFIAALKSSAADSELCDGKLCIQKCCPSNHIVYERKQCVNSSGISTVVEVNVYDKDRRQIGRLGDYFVENPGYFSDESVKDGLMLYLKIYDTFYLLENGTMAMTGKTTSGIDLYNTDEYCVDNWSVKKNSITTMQTAIWVKYRQDDIPENPTIIKYGFLVSSICLLPVLLVYCLLPELRSLGGLILMMYVTSLMMAFLLFFCLQLRFSYKLGCLFMTFLFYFFLMSCFCWMNVMSYDIWWTFRGYAKARPIHRRGEHFKFRVYSLFAWGIPLVMTIALSVLNDMSPESLPGIIKPEIPLKGCFIEGAAKLVYMYIPMLIMILFNCMFFGMTVSNLLRLSRGTNILNTRDSAVSGTESARRSQKQRFIVYLKLSVLMGLTWFLEVISSFYPNFKGWYISDIYNTLVGLIIFIIFICKKKVFRMLKKRFSNFKATNLASSFKSRFRSSRSTEESTSHGVPLKTLSTSN